MAIASPDEGAAGRSWRDIARLRVGGGGLSPEVFRHKPARYAHTDHLMSLSPMLADAAIADALAEHHRVVDRLSSLLIDHFALEPIEDAAGIAEEGRRILLSLHDQGSLRLLLIGACYLADPIRRVIDGRRVGWLINALSKPGYLAVLEHARAGKADPQSVLADGLAACSNEESLGAFLDSVACAALTRWLADQPEPFSRRVTQLMPAGFAKMLPDLAVTFDGTIVAEAMETAADVDFAPSLAEADAALPDE